MSEKKIVAQYTMYVYNTGEVKLVRKDSEDLLKCSSSIRQIIGIINHVIDNPEKHIHDGVTAGVDHVAAQEGVRPQSVYSKITKKLELSMEDFKKLLDQYLNNENFELKKYYIKHAWPGLSRPMKSQ